MSRFKTCAVLAVMLGWAGATLYAADPPKREEPKTDIQVLAIRATTKNKDISPELKDLADKLKQKFKYTGFKLESKQSSSVAAGKSLETPLVGSYLAKITFLKRADNKIELQVQVTKGKEKKIGVTVTLNAGESQLFGGWDLEGGDVLIMAVSAR